MLNLEMNSSFAIKWVSFFQSELIELLTYNQKKWVVLQDLLAHGRLDLYTLEANSIEIGENEENIDQLKVSFF